MLQHKSLPVVLLGFCIFTHPLVKDYVFAVLIFIVTFTFFQLKQRDGLAWMDFQRAFNIGVALLLLVVLRLLLGGAGYSFDFYIIGVSGVLVTLVYTLTQVEVEYLDNARVKKDSSGECFLAGDTAKPVVLYLFNGTVLAGVSGLVLGGNSLSFSSLLFLSVVGSLTAALLGVIPHVYRDYTMPVGTAMTIWLFADIGYAAPPLQLLVAISIAFLLSYLAYRKDIADISAMITATLLGMIIITFTDLRWFLALIAFFAIGGGFTRYRYEYKKSRGVAEERGGVRSYKNVFANSLPAFTIAVAYQAFVGFQQILLIAYLASLATALADTLASEIGQASSSQPRMITTFRKTMPGTDGGVTLVGELASLGGAFVMAVLAVVTQLLPSDFTYLALVTFSGFLGANIDSFLGATLQRRDLLTNNGVNLVSTVASAVIAGGLYSLV
jgi:uncharacterized protein (TIGR00297 family)